MAKKHLLAIENLRLNLERFATEEVKEKVLEKSETLAETSDPPSLSAIRCAVFAGS